MPTYSKSDLSRHANGQFQRVIGWVNTPSGRRGLSLTWAQLSAIAYAAGEAGQREFWLTVCRRRKLSASGLRCAAENRDIIDPVTGWAHGMHEA